MKRQTTLGHLEIWNHWVLLSYLATEPVRVNVYQVEEDCLFVQPVISSKVIEGYCGTGKSSLVDAKACDDALTPFLHKSLANRMFKDCDSWCVYDFEKPESIVYRWDEKASCYEAGGAGNPCFGNVEQSMAMDQKKKKMCKAASKKLVDFDDKDASCTQLVTAMSDQLMKRYCGDLRMSAKSCDEENNDAVKKALANKMFSHCGAWCLFDFDDPSISFGWWPESSCWKKGGCEGHPEESGAQQLKANSCELTTTTTTTTSTSTSTTTSTTITSTNPHLSVEKPKWLSTTQSTTTTSTTTVTTTTVTTTSTITSTSTTTTSTSTTTTSTTTTTTSTSTTTITSTTTTSTSTTTVTTTTTTKTTTSTTTTTTTTETSTTTTTTSTSTVTTTTTTSTITTTTTSTTTETTTTTSTTTITTSTTSTTTITSTSTTTTSTSTTTTSTSTTTRTSTTTTTTSTTTSTTTVTTTSISTTTTSTSTTSTSTTTVTTTTTTSTVTTTTTKAPRETCGICDLENHTDAASWNPVNNGSMTLTGPSIENLLKQDGMTWELMWQSKSKPNMDNAFLMGTWNGLGCWEPGALITIRDDGKLNMLAVINGEYKSLPNLCNKNVLDGEWHHIVATFSQSNKTMRLIVDGCIESELQRTWNPRFQAFNLGYEPGEKGIGSKFLAGPAQRRYKGHDYQHDSRYGRLVFWNRALDPHEISLKHSTACCKTGLVAIYRFDGDYIDALHNFEHFQHAQGEFENEDGPAVCEPPM